MSFISKLKHPTLTEKAREVSVVLSKVELSFQADRMSAKERAEVEGASLVVEWKRGNSRQVSRPIAFSLASGTLHGTTGLTSVEYTVDDKFGTVSGFRWNKSGVLQPKRSEFAVFLQRDPSGKGIHKRGGVIFAECDFDLAPYATEKEEVTCVTFPKKTKGAAACFADVKLHVAVKITSTEKEVEAKQLETRAESLQLNEEESRSLALLLSKQKGLSKDGATFRERKITERYAQEKQGMIKEAEDETLDPSLLAEAGGNANDDFSQPFQDYRVVCNIARMVCGFLVRDRSVEEPAAMPEYSVQAANQLLRTDQWLRAARTEAQDAQLRVAQQLQLAV